MVSPDGFATHAELKVEVYNLLHETELLEDILVSLASCSSRRIYCVLRVFV